MTGVGEGTLFIFLLYNIRASSIEMILKGIAGEGCWGRLSCGAIIPGIHVHWKSN